MVSLWNFQVMEWRHLLRIGKAQIDISVSSETEKGSYLGHGINKVYTTDVLDMMRTMDSSAYTEYEKISKESSNEDRQLNTLKYLTNWYAGAVKNNPSMIDDSENSKKAEQCTTNTDNVDKEIEKLKEEKKQLEQ